MRIVITGATSFIGSAVVKVLLKQGHQVFAVVRPGTRNLNKLPRSGVGLTVVELELEEIDQLPGLITGCCDFFFHFGWDGAGSENRKNREVQQKNVTDSLKALKCAKALQCRRFLFSGSQAEYGFCQEQMNEDDKCNPISEYGKAKVDFYVQAVMLCESWKHQGEFVPQYIHARIFSVYGPGDHSSSLVESCLDSFLHNRKLVLGSCNQLWNYLYIDDLADALIEVMRQPGFVVPGEIYNIAGAMKETKPLMEYVKIMHRLCGGNGSFEFGIRPPNAEGEAHLIPNISKVEQATTWKPLISFEEGIRTMLKNKCIVCKNGMGEALLELPHMPSSAQDIPDQEQVEGDSGISLNLFQCPFCGLVQFDCEPVGYYKDVIRSGGFSTTMVELRRSQYHHLISKYQLEGKHFIEIGCGRGEFLSILKEFPVEISGIEHREDLVELAKAQGLNVWRKFTESETDLLDEMDGRKFDVFLSFNFLEHQPEPDIMLRCIHHNLADQGLGLITVPSLEYIIEHDGYYELIRDHLAYYTFETLEYLLADNGFRVLEQEMINRDTLSVIVQKTEILPDRGTAKGKINRIDVEKLSKSRILINKEIEHWIQNLKLSGKRMAIWGASHQGFTLAATTCLKNEAVYIIDSAPFKQGRYAPASHLPIVAPEYFEIAPVDAVLIVAPGYTNEIADIIKQRFGEEIQVYTLRSNHLEQIR